MPGHHHSFVSDVFGQPALAIAAHVQHLVSLQRISFSESLQDSFLLPQILTTAAAEIIIYFRIPNKVHPPNTIKYISFLKQDAIVELRICQQTYTGKYVCLQKLRNRKES